MTDARVAIVDPYSSGAMLAEALSARHVPLLAIGSTAELPAAMKTRFAPEHFVAVVPPGDWHETLEQVRTFRPTHCLAGFESGVELAERLAQSLDLPTNGTRANGCRRDKAKMSERVHAHGLRTARQLCSADPEALVHFAHHALTWPVIVKPSRSVASDQVRRCDSDDDLRAAAQAILQQPNALGQRNDTVIVQEFLQGTEYIVDVVCCSNTSCVTAFWQYERPVDATAFVPYDAMRLLPYEGARQRTLQDYALRVLKALEIQFGPAHCELMWVDGAPVLIEVGARLSAGLNATLSGLCGGRSQLEETVRALLAPEEFAHAAQTTLCLHRFAANVFLSVPHAGVLVETRHLQQLRALKTFHSLSVVTTPGAPVERVVGRVTLVHPDEQAIGQDITMIRHLQQDGMFVVQVD